MSSRFDASLPKPYSEKWRESYKKENGDSPRVASYQAPGGEAIPFIQKGFRFSGGQSRDTVEYPFGGLWSSEYINEKPQSLTVEGFLRGPSYITLRNKLVEALRVPTNDDNPGFIDLPFWGRFPVVVGDNYEVSENSDEQGQCAVSIPFTRAGQSVAGRQESLSSGMARMESAEEDLQNAAVKDFEKSLEKKDSATFAQAFGEIKNTLLGILGRIQGRKTALNTMTNEILGIMNLIDQGIRAPGELAQAQFNAAAGIVAGILEIKNSAGDFIADMPSFPTPDNERNAVLLFLSAASYSLPAVTLTATQENTKKAIENLYRVTAFLAAAGIVKNMDSLSHKNAEGYWRLLTKLEESIDRENPAVYTALGDVRTALSRELSGRELSTEKRRHISLPVPLLYLAHYLGCDEDKLRELNQISDSFVIEGDLLYV